MQKSHATKAQTCDSSRGSDRTDALWEIQNGGRQSAEATPPLHPRMAALSETLQNNPFSRNGRSEF